MLQNAAIVLVEPLYGGNLGSVARAMANFGLGDLRLVRPAPGILEDPMLEPMAREGGRHILGNIRVFDDLSQALTGVDIALGFTVRIGKKRRDGYALRDAVTKLGEEAAGSSIAGVFGSEDKGLNNQDLEKCHWLVRIPTHETLLSLNLSQAVVLFGYELRLLELSKTSEESSPRNLASVEELEGFYEHLEEVLGKIGFIEEASPARMMNQMRRIISRRLPDSRDVQILRGVLSKTELALKRAAGKKA